MYLQSVEKSFQIFPWSEIIGMRNRVVHAYFDVNFNIVWNRGVER
ncbi:DUF86 domain-containing protein [Thermoleptolyngbya sp. C42_A2020_037]|nr:DUF86 domain-containing protein [Thermoleptolyngbya sp. C42_A2020_037]